MFSAKKQSFKIISKLTSIVILILDGINILGVSQDGVDFQLQTKPHVLRSSIDEKYFSLF